MKLKVGRLISSDEVGLGIPGIVGPCQTPSVVNLQPPTGSIAGGGPVTVSADVTANGSTAIDRVDFYWWRHDQGSPGSYVQRTFIGTDAVPSGNTYSVSWTLPTCGEYQENQKVQLEAFARTDCGSETSLKGDDRVIDGRGC